ncbi:TVP38/TMEM64 family protein [Asticcacaulis sp. AC402]|uniref:TVP38/TMEM64 family protein n=1 Tax=Asticcacaulis sp. AC402 TaxID=1282361 RepID=UPI0003C3F3F2|nr:VTT domain-containing protein [Asticcacaulis sp. AC402]ESQ75597.1 hypothetical protein ABAC402_08720 [Asticcacaulis sp. AC402]
MHNKLHQIWEKVSDFLLNLDAKMIRAVWVSLLLLALVVGVILIGRSPWGQEMMSGLEHWMAQYARSPLAIVIVTVVFCVSGLVGAPQFVLIAASVVAFGPVWGGFYSWFATQVAAAMQFYIGRFAGSGLLQKLGGDRLNKLSTYVGNNAFSASFIVRNIPTAPPIVVNMAFGASHASFWGFTAGCALGSLPKIILVALMGGSLSAFTGEGQWKLALSMAALAAVWLALMLLARTLYMRAKNKG